METQKILDNQSDLEKEKCSCRNWTPWLYYKMQSLKQYGTNTKTEI